MTWPRGHGGTPPSPRGYGVPEWRGFTSGTRNVRAGGVATLGEDPSTPAPVRVDFVSGVAPSGTTASFSPPASSLLVCVINSQGGSQSTSSLSVSDSGGHAWTRRVGLATAGIGVAAVFTAPIAAAPGSITVTGSDSVTSSVLQFAVRVLNGANSNQGSAATATNGGTSANASGSITTTQINSWVFCCAVAANAVNSIAGTTTIDTFTSASIGGPNVIGRQSSPTGTPGATTLGWTQVSGLFSWAALEILHA